MSTKLRLDHYIVGATRAIQDILAAYQEIGFTVSPPEETVRHEPGLRTGFLYFSPKPSMDYIEFLTVEDNETFAAAQARSEEEWTNRPCAQGLGVRVTDAAGVHAALAAQGTPVKPLTSKRPEGAAEDTPFVWSFITLDKPASGLGAFYVQYHREKTPKEPELIDGGNGIYALGGVLYDAASTSVAAADLAKDFPAGIVKVDGADVTIGCHKVLVRTFSDFAAAAGGKGLLRNTELKIYGALLYSSDLAKTAKALNGKWKPHIVRKDEILLVPTDHEGLAAVVRQKDVQEWKKERLGTGEWLF